MARRWENLYNFYKSDQAKERIVFLKQRINDGVAEPDETMEYKKMEKVMKNLSYVENLKEAIDKLDNNLEILEEEYRNRENNLEIEKLEKKAEKLEKDIEEKRAKAVELHEIAENDEYWDAIFEVQKMEGNLSTLRSEISSMEKKELSPELKNYSDSELKKEIFHTSGQISRCHIAAELYMKGEGKSTIDMAIKKFNKHQKFKPKDPLPLTKKEIERRKEKETKIKDEEDAKKEEIEDSKQIEDEEKEEGRTSGKKPQNRSNDTKDREEKQEPGTRSSNPSQKQTQRDESSDSAHKQEEQKEEQEDSRDDEDDIPRIPLEKMSRQAENEDELTEEDIENYPFEEEVNKLIDYDAIKKIAEEDARRKHWFKNLLSKLPFAKNIMDKDINNEIEKRLDEEIERAIDAVEEVHDRFESEKEKVQRERAMFEKVKNWPEEQKRKAEEEKNEEEHTAMPNKKRAEFIRGLTTVSATDLAERGINKLELAKRAAMERQGKKFGERYSEKSGDKAQTEARFNSDDEER